MTESDARSRHECSRFQQRILHARHLLLHGDQRFANHGRTHALSAQVAYFFQLEEVKKGKRFRCRYQPGFLPLDQLSRRDAKNSQNVSSSVSMHWFIKSL